MKLNTDARKKKPKQNEMPVPPDTIIQNTNKLCLACEFIMQDSQIK